MDKPGGVGKENTYLLVGHQSYLSMFGISHLTPGQGKE